MGSFKTRRRQSKYKQILKKELNIESSEEPSKNIMIGNAGLVSGIQYEQLVHLFTQYGSVEKLIMIPGKSYSFIVYSTIEDAIRAFQSVNGQVKLENMDGPIYLVFTLSVPPDVEASLCSSLPEGLTVLSDFVTEEEEELLLNCINWDSQDQELAKSLKHRRVKHFGYEFSYDNNNVDKDSPLTETIPEECNFIPRRLQELGHSLEWIPNQLTVNQYQKGQGIPSHIDTHSAFESPLLSLSLGSDVVMEFKRGSVHRPVPLPRRSLLLMDGEARYVWSHGIVPRTMDVVHVSGGLSVRERGVRTSFTLRRVRESPCHCPFPESCDSQMASVQQSISDLHADKLEELYVHQVYNKIASHFSETRTKVWPNVQHFLQSFSPGSVLVDAGCGNGKYFDVNPSVFQVGFDRSEGLAKITRNRGHEVFVSDCLSLPLRDNLADGVISIAVLHHLATRLRREQAVEEMCRVLVPGGRALISVWAKDQTKQSKTAYLKQDRKNRRDGIRNDVNKNVFKCEKVLNEPLQVNTNNYDQFNERKENCTPHVTEEADKRNDLSVVSNDFQLPIHTARTEFQHQDVFVPWKVKARDSSQDVKDVFLRYYHVFEENELALLCNNVKGINVLETYYTEGNWCVVFEKMKTA